MGNSLKLKSWQGELVSHLNYERCREGRDKICSAVLLLCGIGALAGWPSRISFWAWFPETASCPFKHLTEHSLHVTKHFSAFPNETKVLANRSTSHVLMNKCCSVTRVQGVSSVSAYLELVGSQLYMSCSCVLLASAVWAHFSKVLWLVGCHS